MWAAFLMIVPTGLVLGLMAFGHYGRRDVRPTFRSVFVIGVVAILVGPVAVLALGFLTWMIVVGLGVAALTMLALLRTPREPLGG
jgi:hypothetical protein